MKVFFVSMLIAISAVLAPGQNRPASKPFTIIITADARTMKVGSDVWVKVTLTNTASQSLDTSANVSGLTGIDPNFFFDMRDGAGNSVPKRVYDHPELATGHPILNRFLRPGESLAEEQDISRLYDMNHPGIYVVQVSRRVSDIEKDGVVKSNKITVTVTR